ncbi:MAG: elongation factor P [Candidatus Actinomarina sp.]|jgi:elongation factor P|tara:strand:- start:62 stop:622 length:561 start_codon:yes stop_codon:yes gene_type:complete
MVSTNDIRPGQSIIVDNIIYQIMEYAHVKPGKGKAFVKTKLKNMKDGGIIEKTFRADENVEQAFIDKKQFQYLYNEGDSFIFMNNETFDQLSIDQSKIENIRLLLVPNNEVTIQLYENNPIDVLLPPSVELMVTKAEPAVKGDTVTSSTKTVTCETGLEVVVPMFIAENDIIKIDSKDKSYMTRVS